MKRREKRILFFLIIFFLLTIAYIFNSYFLKPCPYQSVGLPDNLPDVIDEFQERIRLLPSDNGTYHTIRPLPLDRWKQHKFQPHGSYSFVQFSAYRFSPKIIHLLGIGEVIFKRNQFLGACTWHGKDGNVIIGKFHMIINGERPSQYGSRMYKCIFENETGNGGGYLVGDINGEENVLFREEANMTQSMGDDEAFEFNHTYCTAPLHGHLHAKMIWQWIEYHRVLFDADSFVFYYVDYDMAALMPYIQSYVDKGSMEIIDFSDILAFKIFYYGQVVLSLCALLMSLSSKCLATSSLATSCIFLIPFSSPFQSLAAWDCVNRYAFKSKWIYLHDVDEYLQVYPPHTLSSILQENKERPWITHGMINWDVERCIHHASSSSSSSSSMDDVVKEGKVVIDYEEEFAVERMVYRNRNIYCTNASFHRPMCLHWQGHRKLIVNPRKVLWVEGHNVVFSNGTGINLNASSDMVHNHFRGIHSIKKERFCSKLYDEEYRGERWIIRDDSLAALTSYVRSCLKDSTLCTRM